MAGVVAAPAAPAVQRPRWADVRDSDSDEEQAVQAAGPATDPDPTATSVTQWVGDENPGAQCSGVGFSPHNSFELGAAGWPGQPTSVEGNLVPTLVPAVWVTYPVLAVGHEMAPGAMPLQPCAMQDACFAQSLAAAQLGGGSPWARAERKRCQSASASGCSSSQAFRSPEPSEKVPKRQRGGGDHECSAAAPWVEEDEEWPMQTNCGLPAASEEEWLRRADKRRQAVALVKSSDEYQALEVCRRLPSRRKAVAAAPHSPDPLDRTVSKRRWEEEVRQWRASLRKWSSHNGARLADAHQADGQARWAQD